MNRTRILVAAAVVVALVLVAGGVFFAITRPDSFMKGGSLGDTAELMPKTTTGVIAAKGFVDLALEFRNALPPDAKQDDTFSREFQEVMGFDPTDTAAWRNTGVDFGRPWALATLGRNVGQSEMLILIPITDQKRARATVDRIFQKAQEQQKGLTQEEVSLEGGQKAWLFKAQNPYDQTTTTPLAFTERADHLVAIAGMSPAFDAQRALQDYLSTPDQESLAAQPDFERALGSLGNEWHLFVYGDDALYRPFLAQFAGNTDNLEGFAADGLALTVRYTEEKVITRLAILNSEGSRVNQVLVRGKDALGAQIGGEALAAGRFSVDVPATWQIAKKALQDEGTYHQVLQEAQARGVDLEKDIVGNLTGNISFAVYEPQGQGAPVDAVVWAGVKNQDAFARAVAAVAEGFTRTEADGQQWWSRDGMSLGLAKDHLIFASSDGRQEAVKESLAQKTGSYLDALPPAAKAELVSGPAFYSYVDLNRSRTVMDRNAAGRVDPGQKAMIEELTGASLSMDGRGTVVLVELILNAREGAMARALTASGRK